MANNPDNENESQKTAPEAASPETPSQYLGLLLKERYLIEREIGRGGIGVVYLARDRQLLSRPVVIKVLVATNSDQSFTEWFQKKFRHEMEALVRINHPGVVAVLDSGEMPDGKPFIVMQFVEGMTLRSAMNLERLEFARVARIARQMGQALAAAHGKGVCHRDLKPENIMIEPLGGGEEQVKLIDFGIARVKDSQVGTSAELTWVAGTPPYMSPEQLRGRPTTESDIYSFGAVMYEVLTGRTPFNAESTVDLYELQRGGEIVPPKQLRPDLPEAAQAALLKALSFDLKERYQTALEFSEDLSRALSTARSDPASVDTASEGPGARLTATTRRQGRETTADLTRVENNAPPSSPASRNRKPLFVAGLIVGLLLAALLVGSIFRPQPAAPETPPVVTLPERALDYWIVARKYRDQRPFGDPFRLPGEIMFNAEDRARLHLAVSETGYFYLINEGPEPVQGLPSYVVLFPKPTINDSSAQLTARQELQFPERGDGFEFDKERGTEKLWLVWAADPVPALEAIKSVVNARQRGAVTDPAQIAAVRDFLGQAHPTPSAQKDEAKQQTRVAARGAVLVHQIKLLHY
ncbi:MAG: protein kinase [Blastocatellia bacterium]|nr:protein kinase [Blastocatellia bacterium]